MTYRKLQKSSLTLSDVHDLRGMFNPQRLTVARKRRGLTKSGLASKIGVDLRAVTAFEAHEYAPSEETLEKIRTALGFPREFFCGDDLDFPSPDTASFRGMSKMRPALRDMALAQGAIALHLGAWLETKFELPSVELPDLSHERSPEEASISLRQLWGIGELPIRNVIHLLEAKGIRIFSLAVDTRQVDAFSMWRDSVPFIFLNNNKSSEHSRFDAAHELGHLVLHRHGSPQGREAEKEADIFASAFLMPRSMVIARAPRFPTLDDLIKLKRIWATSVAALNYRLHSVGMLTDWQYRTLCAYIAKAGFRAKEPNEAQRETSQLLPRLFGALYEDGISRAEVARRLSLPQSELEFLMFGLTMTAIEGQRGAKQNPPTRPRLALVEKA